MKTVNHQLLAILPESLRQNFPYSKYDRLCEIRMHIGQPAAFCFHSENQLIGSPMKAEDLKYTVNTASQYSPWNAVTVNQGYLTAPGGHRIGICGDDYGDGIRSLSSLCIRIAKNIEHISDSIPIRGSLLILGAPGCGKTTLLRDYIRRISDTDSGAVSVVDERGEIFPKYSGIPVFPSGSRTDILSGCSKAQGIPRVLRSMGPEWIALDEITQKEDCEALSEALWCGVKIIATAHASCVQDLLRRPVYEPIVKSRIFDSAVVLHKDKSYHMERIII